MPMTSQALDGGDMRVAMVSHELRGPIHAIMIGLEILRRTGLGSTEGHVIQRIYNAATRMSALADQFLGNVEHETGAPILLQREDVNLADLCDESLDECRMGHPDREIKLIADRGIRGSWDRLQLIELVSNLIQNALQHGDPSAPVWVYVCKTPSAAQIEVANKGPEIPSELLPTIFEPFRRGVRSSGGTGVGLGLYIVAKIVAAHFGTVEVGCERGTTRFTVTLPVGSR
jgi:signal transduction histidine kinase